MTRGTHIGHPHRVPVPLCLVCFVACKDFGWRLICSQGLLLCCTLSAAYKRAAHKKYIDSCMHLDRTGFLGGYEAGHQEETHLPGCQQRKTSGEFLQPRVRGAPPLMGIPRHTPPCKAHGESQDVCVPGNEHMQEAPDTNAGSPSLAQYENYLWKR